MAAKSTFKPTKTVAEIAKKHGNGEGYISKQLEKGIKTEMEHTRSKRTARTIALHHLEEDADYYVKLKKAKL